MKNGVTVTRKYLEVGHAFVKGDSVHSHIEKKLKHKDIMYLQIILASSKIQEFGRSPMKSRTTNSYHTRSSKIMKQ